MDESARLSDRPGPPGSALRRLGLVVHPTREIEEVLDEIGAWASRHRLTVGQVPVRGQTRRVADQIEADECDLLLAIGGDGTTLLALHAGAPRSRPVLGVACGSIGALTSVTAERVPWALEQVAGGRWTLVAVPGLEVAWRDERGGVAINDVAIIRDGPGQVTVAIVVDEVLYARVAGDGLVVATARREWR
jgi:NAD+ kinase